MSNEEVKVLIFSINDEYYATDIMEVERILGFEEPTKLPDSPSFVHGVINYEGSILPVISLCKRFGLKESEKKNEAKIIVAKDKENKIGIIVDVVCEVRDVKGDNIEEPPEIVSGISKRYIKGLIKIDSKIIIFLNLGNILTEEEKTLIPNQT
ncbi:purine-binding chemotaxis protein CheW [Clostridium tetanomorphum]|uniref:Purine-binding chemotaxis protein CheW n=1 Tax=Clostridium tetanomorphum TaxID=1553 RepID=A0A923J159_CLOTT|nr:chemotaxis protein CheW [Clostridium tetanomorphum]KAJ53486.1 positive regulator of CheA protein activity (CheW) [Clostridium tetanomorphum DSM 665]MBC2398439.1 purine-binding chemotaxis protein CheW [Clostridium tetanomorphum]MBP1865281.1 purine-binding chemotaxis protein CheW [Clostridium tetanomorphum]NRS85204.1 purine-binding chemotaxis protein CheW [Clostridium tetanomorphum]NRZ98383.1 purine-binding chemotaxis protein CheW [Clostridium tetanomorphum]